MSYLSYRHMGFTLHQLELIQWAKDAEILANLPADRERCYYWFLERKARRGKNKWIFVRDLRATKREAAEIFVKHYRNRKETFRLRHIMKYNG